MLLLQILILQYTLVQNVFFPLIACMQLHWTTFVVVWTQSAYAGKELILLCSFINSTKIAFITEHQQRKIHLLQVRDDSATYIICIITPEHYTLNIFYFMVQCD